MSFAFGRTPPEPSVWSVSAVTSYIRQMFEVDYRLRDLTVEGEISNLSWARSGHLYFTLKDAQAQLGCVMWRSSAERLVFRPQDGDAVRVSGQISVYEAGGRYQLYAVSLLPTGRGDLALAFERLKERLAAEGLFDPAHKKALPPFPRKVGVVTSADAAALRDILNVLGRRYPLATVLIAPTLVQGADAPPQIVRALHWLDGRDDIDVIIVARGGGSLEDLWAFNDEGVARAIFTARHPVISGVGHEVDFTIADFVADVRAPTPSAAAELVAPDVAELRAYVGGLVTALERQMTIGLEQRQRAVQSAARNLVYLSPRARIANHTQRLDELIGRLQRSHNLTLTQRQAQLAASTARLHAVSPQATLARGYAIVRRLDGQIVRTAATVQAGERLTAQLADGRLALRAEADGR